eukprot:7006545-Pyramimonas_sp.AAC.1
MGPTAAASWGSSVLGVAPAKVAGLRVGAANFLGRLSKGASVWPRMCTGGLGSKIDLLIVYAGHVLFTRATAVWEFAPRAQVL